MKTCEVCGSRWHLKAWHLLPKPEWIRRAEARNLPAKVRYPA